MKASKILTSRAAKYFGIALVLTFACAVLLCSFQTDKAINKWVVVGKMQTARAGACSVPSPMAGHSLPAEKANRAF
jgi:hypothetical protein